MKIIYIVLTHYKRKELIISASKILKIYKKYFIKALNESDTLVLFGYSGEDDHINKAIKDWAGSNSQKKTIFIVEHKETGNCKNKIETKTEKSVKIEHRPMENILKFNFEELLPYAG